LSPNTAIAVPDTANLAQKKVKKHFSYAKYINYGKKSVILSRINFKLFSQTTLF